MPAGDAHRSSRIRSDRVCRDLLFLVTFLAFCVGMLVVGGRGFAEGDPKVLVYGFDYKGQLCDEGDLDGYTVTYWPNPQELARVVSTDINSVVSDPSLLSLSMKDVLNVCVKKCPQPSKENLWVCVYPNATFFSNTSDFGDRKGKEALAWWSEQKNYDFYDQLTPALQQRSRGLKGPCYPNVMKGIEQFQACMFYELDSAVMTSYQDKVVGNSANSFPLKDKFTANFTKDIGEGISDYLSSPLAIMERYIGDIFKAWPVLVVSGLLAPLILGFIWLLFTRFFAGIMAWTTLLLVNVLAILVTFFFYLKAGIVGKDEVSGFTDTLPDNLDSHLNASEENKSVLTAIAVFSTILTVLLVLFSLVMIPRIYLAIKVIKVACNAIAAVPSVMLQPILPFVVMVLFALYWVIAAVYIYASGEPELRDCGKTRYDDCDASSADHSSYGELCSCGYQASFDRSLQYALLYHVFGLLWISQFIIAVSMGVIAGAIAYYYWDRSSLPLSPVIASTYRTFRYHTGSFALGSFLVAVLQFVQMLMHYLEKKMQEASPDNPIVKYVGCCVRCYLSCLESCVKFLNRNAYILIAIEGDNFCTSAFHAAKLIASNLLRVAAVNLVGDSILFLGKLVVALASGVIAHAMLDRMDNDNAEHSDSHTSSPLIPVILVILIAYQIASLFMGVVELAIDTILLSYCLDCEENGGHAASAPPLLRDYVAVANTELDKS